MPAGAEPKGRASEPGFEEVGQVPLLQAPEVTGSTATSGWLILDPTTRRGYQVFETSNPTRTVVQSFNLDTLQPVRRAVLAGAPITSGVADVANTAATQNSGDIVHAVDQERGIVYLALSQTGPEQLLAGLNSPDAQRPLARLVAIDEWRFDQGSPKFAASFREPADPLQAKLHQYWLLGLAVSRHHVEKNERGRLLALFAMPQPIAGSSTPYDHTLAQWDPSNLTFDDEGAAGSTGEDATRIQTVDGAGPTRWLDVCSGATVATAGGTRQGNYQWGLLATRDAVYTACQATDQAGAVVRAALDADGFLMTTGNQERYALSQKVSDVLVDEGGGRLLVKSWGGGNTWWVFDSLLRRFTGAVAAKSSDDYSLAAGLDPTTGRLYQLTQDYQAGGIPVRGGFGYSDTRLDPAPPLENAVPALAYPATFAIRVDPVTRQVFVRRGHPTARVTPVYPGTGSTTPAPAENLYRVLKDSVPITERPPAIDDSGFTTDTAEDPATTRASYLGSGSSYGSRAWLVGGVQAATNNLASPCGKDDRELLAGSVRGAQASDQSTAADAAGLDADAKTQDDLRTGSNCAPPGGELAFGPEGQNQYRATCTGDDKGEATAPPDKRISRNRYKAEATCDHADGRARASSEGALSLPELDAAQDGARDNANKVPQAGGSVPAEHAEVGYASSEVKVARKVGQGITVTVEAVARNVVIPGVGTIGAVRAEATAHATGRRGGAGATYSRTVCGVRFPSVFVPGCLSEENQADLERRMNEDLGGRGRIKFRPPDPLLFAGSASGYRAGVQRPAADGFEDQRISRDTSLALPAVEVVLYNGDGSGGVGRQFLHLAGVQASVSYGIACLYGEGDDGRCAGADDLFGLGDGDEGFGAAGGEPEVVTVYEPGEPVPYAVPASSNGRRSLLERIVKAPFRVAADVFRLLFSNPREFGLMAAVWALLYAPCYLGERRRSIRALRAQRAAVGGVA